MRRRHLLTVVGTSVASLQFVSPTLAAGEDGLQPVRGDLPNENVQHAPVFAFPESDRTREIGQFLTLTNGWVFPECTGTEQKEFFDRTRQTFVFDGQRFVLDSFQDWKPYQAGGGRFLFNHTDPPKSKGETFQVTWDTVYTADFDNPCVDTEYDEGDHHAGFPFESSYEVVRKTE